MARGGVGVAGEVVITRVDPTWNDKRLEAEIDRCLNGGGRQSYQHGDDILWLMGWADLTIELELAREEAE